MKELRPGTRRTARRAAFRARYATYMTSAWYERRRAWLSTRLATGRPPRCVICDREWTLADDLHHATYDRLCHEHDTDLVPACWPCHQALHDILDNSRHWRRQPRRLATASIVTILRQAMRS